MLSVRSNPSPSGHCGRVLGRGLDCADLHNADEGLRNDDEDGIRIGAAMALGAVHTKKRGRHGRKTQSIYGSIAKRLAATHCCLATNGSSIRRRCWHVYL